MGRVSRHDVVQIMNFYLIENCFWQGPALLPEEGRPIPAAPLPSLASAYYAPVCSLIFTKDKRIKVPGFCQKNPDTKGNPGKD